MELNVAPNDGIYNEDLKGNAQFRFAVSGAKQVVGSYSPQSLSTPSKRI
jgi:hypothetical protein